MIPVYIRNGEDADGVLLGRCWPAEIESIRQLIHRTDTAFVGGGGDPFLPAAVTSQIVVEPNVGVYLELIVWSEAP